jgi:hypothetical protein
MAFDPFSGFAAAEAVAGLADDAALPIFDVLPVQLKFAVAADFVAGQAANNVLVIALSNGRILRIDLNKPEDIDGALFPSVPPHPNPHPHPPFQLPVF